jgi:DNA repair exonuclease SbcCD nuclease subunit
MNFIFATDIHLSSINPGSRIDDYPEAALKKIKYLLQRCKEEGAVLLLGGDLFMTPTQPDYIKNGFKQLILDSKVHVISIIGNHDILWYSEEYLDKTSFRSLVSPGVMTYLGDMVDDTLTIGGWDIKMHKFGKDFPDVQKENTIIISHAFYGKDKEEKLNVSKQDVYRSKAKIVCFGHDHNQYDLEENNGTFVVRPGALTRGTSHTENKTREVGFALIHITEDNNVIVNYEKIPFALKFEEVFREKYEVSVEKKVVSFDEIQQFIDNLRTAKIDINPYDILLNLGKGEKVVKKATYYLEAVGLFNN